MPACSVHLLHCADLHIDTPFEASDVEKAQLLREELRNAFYTAVDYTKANGVDIMLLCGDIFDREFVTFDTVNYIINVFSENPDCRFVISPGKNDCFVPGSVYDKIKFPGNVYIFSDSELTFFSFDDIHTDVYGYAFTGRKMPKNPFSAIAAPANPGRINILCGYGNFEDMSSEYCPISQNDILNSPFDYIALGQIHNTEGIDFQNGTYFGYSGCLMGRNFKECGYKGAYSVTLSKNSGSEELTADISMIRFTDYHYEVLKVDVSGAASSSAVYSRIAEEFSRHHYDEYTLLEVSLTGNISPNVIISQASVRDLLENRIFSLKIADHTLPLRDYETVCEETEENKNIRSEFFRVLRQSLYGGTQEERECAALALRYGLLAINGSDF